VSPLRRGAAATLQLNIGLYCNQVCSARMLRLTAGLPSRLRAAATQASEQSACGSHHSIVICNAWQACRPAA
jgi:hypothetical protein